MSTCNPRSTSAENCTLGIEHWSDPRLMPSSGYCQVIFARALSGADGLQALAVARPSSLPAGHRNALHFHHKTGNRYAGDGDQSAGGKALFEDLLAELYEAVAEPTVGDEHRHRHHLPKPAAAGLQ